MKIVSQEYKDLLAKDYDVTGKARIRAEWSWNNTSYLALPAKRGVRLQVIDNSELYKDIAGSTGEDVNKDDDVEFFNLCFDIEHNNALNGVTEYIEYNGQKVTNEDGSYIENPMFHFPSYGPIRHHSASWSPGVNMPKIPYKKHFSIIQEFHVDIVEEGWYIYRVLGDDRYEVRMFDDANGIERIALANYRRAVTPNENEGIEANLEERTGYIARYYPVPGRYYWKTKLQNIDMEWGFKIEHETPRDRREAGKPAIVEMPTLEEMKQSTFKELLTDNIIYPEDQNPTSNPQVVGLERAIEKNTYYDEEEDTIKFAHKDIELWNANRKYFPVESLVEYPRPTSGINYNWSRDGVVLAHVMDQDQWIAAPFEPKKPRYYSVNRDSQYYKYWISDCESIDQPIDGGYPIPLADIVVTYTKPVATNKIRAVFNIGAMPRHYKILYSPEADGDEWFEAVNEETATIDPYTGELEVWRQSDGMWSSNPYFDTDTSHEMRRIRLVVMTMEEPRQRVEVIELSANKHVDITSDTLDFKIDMNMDEKGQFRVMGQSSANSGNIILSNIDGRFDVDHVDLVRRSNISQAEEPVPGLKDIVERSTKITFDILYDVNGREEFHRIGTFYGNEWSKNAQESYSIKLFDAAKKLQNIDAPSMIFEDEPIHVILGHILDYVGFSDYSLDLSDFKKNQIPGKADKILTPVLKYFASSSDDTVWETIQKVCEATYSAVYIDEFGVLQLMTKDEMTRAMQIDQTSGVVIEPVSHVFRGQYDGDNLPNIYTFEQSSDYEANSVTIVFKPKKIKQSNDPYNPQILTDILWKADKTIVLQATRLAQVIEEDEKNSFYLEGDPAEIWPYKGRANINGEVVAWEGKEYQWIEYIYEEYADVIVNVTTVPTLIRPNLKFLSEWIDGAAKVASDFVTSVPESLNLLLFKVDLSGLKNWMQGIIKVSRESGQALLHVPKERTSVTWITNPIDSKDGYVLDRILKSKITRKEWIYSESERQARQELTGRNNAYERLQNRFTGRLRFVPQIKDKRGRGADDSKYQARHTVVPKSGWMPKKNRRGSQKIENGYYTGEEGLTFFPILNDHDSDDRGGFQTAVGVRRPYNKKISKNDDTFIGRTMDKPIQTLGFRFRFMPIQHGVAEIGLVFNMSKQNGFSGGILGGGMHANNATIPADMNDCNQWYKLVIKETSDDYNRAKTNEIDAQVFTPDSGYRHYWWGFQSNGTGHAATYQLANMNPTAADDTVRHIGYPHLIERRKWYDVQVEMFNGGLFNVVINGIPVGSFTNIGNAKQNRPLPVSRHFALSVSSGTHAEFDNVWTWSEKMPVTMRSTRTKLDPQNRGYISSFLESGELVPEVIKEMYEEKTEQKFLGFNFSFRPYEFFYDEFGSVVREIRDFDVKLDKGPGTNMTYYVSNSHAKMIDQNYQPDRATFSLVNLATHNIIVQGEERISNEETINHTMVIYGYKLEEEQEAEITRKNIPAIKDRGEIKEEINAEWISSDEEALELANWVLQTFSDPKDSLSLSVFPDATYSIGDRAQVIYDRAGVDPEWIYMIVGISHSFGEKGLQTDVELRRIRNNVIEYFDIDDPEYGIKRKEINLADQRDTGAISEGGVTGLTLKQIKLPNPTGKEITNTANDSPTWKARWPVAGAIFDFGAGLAFDIIGSVAQVAITAGVAAIPGIGPGVAPIVGAIANGIFSQVLNGVAQSVIGS